MWVERGGGEGWVDFHGETRITNVLMTAYSDRMAQQGERRRTFDEPEPIPVPLIIPVKRPVKEPVPAR